MLSRKIEEYVLYHVLRQNSVQRGYIAYKKTDKNFELISQFLKNNFFSKVSNKDKKKLNLVKSKVLYQVENNKKLNNVKKFFKR